MSVKRVVVLGVVVMAALALLPTASVAAAAPPAFCDDDVLNADHVPARFSLENCDVIGKTIVGGGVRMRIPRPGTGQSISSMTTDGETGLDVFTTRAGVVEVTVEQESAEISTTAVPANDTYGNAQSVLPADPFDWSVDGTTNNATTGEARDVEADSFCPSETPPSHTVWFTFNAQRTEDRVLVDAVTADATAGVRADVFVAPEGDGGFGYGACAGEDLWSVVQDTTYYIRVSSVAPADFSLRWRPPRPVGNNFAAPNVITPPFMYDNYTTDAMLGATMQPGEPSPSCKATGTTGTVWHRIEPGSLRRLLVFPSNGGIEGSFAFYTGSSLSGLSSPFACSAKVWQRYVTLPAAGPYYAQHWGQAGDTYGYFSVMSGEPFPMAVNPCDEKSRALRAWGPRKPLRWHFNGAKTPAELSATSAQAGIASGMSVITGSKNDCGMTDYVSAQTEYLGKTTRTSTACNQATAKADGVNAVDFGQAITGAELASACSWTRVGVDGVERVTETDIRLTANVGWTRSPDAISCSGRYDIVGVVAHEVGHAFGLMHPYYEGNQTMSASGQSCNGGFRTLGKGDVLALRARY